MSSLKPSAPTVEPQSLAQQMADARRWVRLARLRLFMIYLSIAYVVLLHAYWGIEESSFLGRSSALATGAKMTGYDPCYPMGFIVAWELLAYFVWPRRRVQWWMGAVCALVSLIFFLMTCAAAEFEIITFSEFREPTKWYWCSVIVAGCMSAVSFIEWVLIWRMSSNPFGFATKQLGKDSIVPAYPHKAQVIILVHGTGSAHPDACGTAWWQVGSEFWTLVHSLHPGLLSGPSETDVFHWSGSNREGDRRDAGVALLKVMRRFEVENREYHLIGHSHGGSVIWHALRAATRRKANLPNLRSWITLGTPFLRFGPDVRSLPRAIPLMAASVMAALGFHVVIDICDVGFPGLAESTWDWLLLLFAAVCLLVAAGGGLLQLIAVSIATMRYGTDLLADKHVIERFASRWLCLWSRSDEAINGLRGTLNIDWRLFHQPNRGIPTGVIARIIRIFTVPFANPIVSAALDAALWRRIQRRLQGNDILGATLIAVEPAPLGLFTDENLAAEIETEVTKWANEHASKSLNAIRSTLGLLAVSSTDLMQITQGISHRLNGRELIHFSYYQVPSVLALVTRHLTLAMTSDVTPSMPLELPATKRHRSSTYTIWRKNWPTWALSVVLTLLTLTAGLAIAAVHSHVVQPFTDREIVAGVLWDGPEVCYDDQALIEWARVFLESGLMNESYAVERTPSAAKLAIIYVLKEKGRYTEAASMIEKISHPFYKAVAYMSMKAAVPLVVTDLTWIPEYARRSSSTRSIFESEVASLNRAAEGLVGGSRNDPFVRSALRLRNADSVRSSSFLGSEDDELRSAAYTLAEAWSGDAEAILKITQGVGVSRIALLRVSLADAIALGFHRSDVPNPTQTQLLESIKASVQWADPQEVINLIRLANQRLTVIQAAGLEYHVQQKHIYFYELLKHHVSTRHVTRWETKESFPPLLFMELEKTARQYDRAADDLANMASGRFQRDTGYYTRTQATGDELTEYADHMVLREFAESTGDASLVRRLLDHKHSSDSGILLERAKTLAAIGDYYEAWGVSDQCIPSHQLQVRTAILRHYLNQPKSAIFNRRPEVAALFRQMDERNGFSRSTGFLTDYWR